MLFLYAGNSYSKVACVETLYIGGGRACLRVCANIDRGGCQELHSLRIEDGEACFVPRTGRLVD